MTVSNVNFASTSENIKNQPLAFGNSIKKVSEQKTATQQPAEKPIITQNIKWAVFAGTLSVIAGIITIIKIKDAKILPQKFDAFINELKKELEKNDGIKHISDSVITTIKDHIATY